MRKLPLKIVVLEALIHSKLNRIEAAHLIGDSALNSTVSHLQQAHCIAFTKSKEPFTHRGGESIPLTRYQVSEGGIELAWKVINHYRNKVRIKTE